MIFKKQIIGEKYLTRWHLLPRNPFFNIYLHKFTGDDQKLPHCHPWNSFSLLLRGCVREFYICKNYQNIEDKYKHMLFAQSLRLLRPGSMVYRNAEFTHRLQIVDGPVWTLFFTFRRRRSWGFYTKRGFVKWYDALNVRGKILERYK